MSTFEIYITSKANASLQFSTKSAEVWRVTGQHVLSMFTDRLPTPVTLRPQSLQKQAEP